MQRPVAVAGRDLDAGRGKGEVAAGLGMRAGVGLVGLGVASRGLRGRGEDGGDERVAILNLLICFKQLHTKYVHTHSGSRPLVEDLPPGGFPWLSLAFNTLLSHT